MGISVQTLLSLCGERIELIKLMWSSDGRKELGGAGLSDGSRFDARASIVPWGVVVGVPSVFDKDPSSMGVVPFFLRKLCSFAAVGRELILSVCAIQCLCVVLLMSFLYSFWPC